MDRKDKIKLLNNMSRTAEKAGLLVICNKNGLDETAIDNQIKQFKKSLEDRKIKIDSNGFLLI